MPFTTPFVASGTNAGVRTSPCVKRRTPVRAREPGSRWWMSSSGDGTARDSSARAACRTYDSLTARLWKEPIPEDAEQPQLLVAELREEAAADAGDVGRPRVLQQLDAGLRDAGEGPPRVVRAGG